MSHRYYINHHFLLFPLSSCCPTQTKMIKLHITEDSNHGTHSHSLRQQNTHVDFVFYSLYSNINRDCINVWTLCQYFLQHTSCFFLEAYFKALFGCMGLSEGLVCLAWLHSTLQQLYSQSSGWSSSVSEFRLLSHNQRQWWKINPVIVFFQNFWSDKRGTLKSCTSSENFTKFATMELEYLIGSDQLFLGVLLYSYVKYDKILFLFNYDQEQIQSATVSFNPFLIE